MFIILGGTGHVGSAVVRALLERGEQVTAIAGHPGSGGDLAALGARIEVADVNDIDHLRTIFRTGRRAFLLNPPGDIAGDPSQDERRSAFSIVSALEGSGLEKVVMESTYGAQPGKLLGDLSTLFELEQTLATRPIPATFNRAAYYMSNWDASLESARTEGVVKTFYPVDFKLPMVAPQDIGKHAAALLLEAPESIGVRMIEGPERYSSSQVAAAFAAALGKPVKAIQIPESDWPEAFKAMGFSEVAAESFANMTRLTIGGDFPEPDTVSKGTTTLDTYIESLVK